MVRPSILHIDNDYTNNEASNLKWVEESSQEYQDFCIQRRKDMSVLNLQYSTLH